MIEVEKTYSDNPFVDEILYNSKYIALNSVVKDEEEALSKESPESLKLGEAYVSCKEGSSSYVMFDSFPEEILEKYIARKSNIDMMVEDYNVLKVYLNSLSDVKATDTLDNITKLARVIYIDHYNIMLNYIKDLGPTWITDNKPLYDICMNSTATYLDLFETMPKLTVEKILKSYVLDYTAATINGVLTFQSFKDYVASRTDGMVEELYLVNNAMRSCFISHYDKVKERDYFKNTSLNNWFDYTHIASLYNKCVDGIATYLDLYDYFPVDDRLESLKEIISDDDIDSYNLNKDYIMLRTFFTTYESSTDIETLNISMRKKYMDNYNVFLNTDVYNRCRYESISYEELMQYIPAETLKVILKNYVKEVDNIKTFSENKVMLDMYLNGLLPDTSTAIKDNIAKDMRKYYIDNYVEYNNYYRTIIGQPPINSNTKVIYKDTLTSTYNEKTGEQIFLTNDLVEELTNLGIYPESHWNRPEIYKFDAYDVSILKEYGIIDKYIELCGGMSDRYRYLNYIGDNALDNYVCRKGENFQLISIPNIQNTEIQSMFKDKYAINRDYIIKTVYSDAYKFGSDHYNKFIIIFIMMNTIMDMLTTIPEMIIRRQIFDTRAIKYLFESYGIPYYSEIPVKYQQAMLKNLNMLIKYKSSTKNMVDICSLFGFNDIKVFEYYMFKERNKDSNTGEFEFDYDNDIHYDLSLLYVKDAVAGIYEDASGIKFSKLVEYRDYDRAKYTKEIYVENQDGSTAKRSIIDNKAEVYIRDGVSGEFISLLDTEYFKHIKADTSVAELKFIKVPIKESLTDYKNDTDYIVSYDEVTSADDSWIGDYQEEDLEARLLDREFNAVRTKYISVETLTQMTELSFQVSYFYNMLFDNYYSEEKLTMEIPYIKTGHKFRFMDVISYLFSLMYLYNNLKDNIMYSPTQILYIKGYNFGSDTDEILNDISAFTQPANPMDKENIFNINDRILADNYNYRDAFKGKNIRGFNLDADIDALELWLNKFQLSLDDFVVDDTLTTFNQVITLRNFFSLNNSYYQKNIFTNDVTPMPYNQDILYSYLYELKKINVSYDLNGRSHYHILQNETVEEVINNADSFIYVRDTYKYCSRDSINITLYHKYNKGNGILVLDSVDHYYYAADNKLEKLCPYTISLKDAEGNYILSADNFYYLSGADYIKFTDPKYFYTDSNGKTILTMGRYYIQSGSNYILDPLNCYVKIEKNGVQQYILASSISEYELQQIAFAKLYVIRNSSYVLLQDTDYYTQNPDGSYTYNEEDCYFVVDYVTVYHDSTTGIYYEKLSDYYNSGYTIYKSDYYVKTSEGDYLHESKLVNPTNCYVLNNNTNVYELAISSLYTFSKYPTSANVSRILVLNTSNIYDKFEINLSNLSYAIVSEPTNLYVRSSDEKYVTILDIATTNKYSNDNQIVVVLNRFVGIGTNLNNTGAYNPEDDGVWDENDWFYSDTSYDSGTVGINGENNWYYEKPDGNIPSGDIEEEEIKIGSGFYIPSTSYIGTNPLEVGCVYYMSMDIETNFDNKIQIACEADSSYEAAINKIYNIAAGEIVHIEQTFTANNTNAPRILFYIYNYKTLAIERGDYFIIKNVRFVKAYNDNYIPQDIPSYVKLQELYNTNEAIYKFLNKMMAECSDKYKYDIYKKLYDSLMVSKYNKEAFRLSDTTYAETYTDFLQTRDSVLYEKLIYFKSLDLETMRKQIADNIIEVTYAIDGIVDTYSYGYLYSYFPAVSANYVQQYISKIINFFKSWKVHLLGINTIYKFDDKLDNAVKILEEQEFRNRIEGLRDSAYINHSLKINPLDDTNSAGFKYTDLYNDLEKVTHRYPDMVEIKHDLKIIRATDDTLDYVGHDNSVTDVDDFISNQNISGINSLSNRVDI